MKKISLILALILVIFLPGLAGAWTQQFRNDFALADAIYLWMDTPSTVFFGTTRLVGGHSDWELAVDLPDKQFMYGPPKPAGTGGIMVTFDAPRGTPFSFQWAEVNWTGATSYEPLGSGTISWDGRRWQESSAFSHGNDIVPIPIPASLLLLGTGILGLSLLGFRRKHG